MCGGFWGGGGGDWDCGLGGKGIWGGGVGFIGLVLMEGMSREVEFANFVVFPW